MEQASFNFMAAVIIQSDFGAPKNKILLKTLKNKTVTASTFSPSICHEVMGPDAMILVFLMLSFKPAFSLLSSTFFKRLFSCWKKTVQELLPDSLMVSAKEYDYRVQMRNYERESLMQSYPGLSLFFLLPRLSQGIPSN